MIYIKLFVCILIVGILSSVKAISFFAVPEYFLCMSVSIALIDKNTTRATILVVIFAVISSALTAKPMIFCVILYTLAAIGLTETKVDTFKKGITFSLLAITALTILGETFFYLVFVNGNFKANFTDILFKETISNLIAMIILYSITYRIYNIRQRKFKIIVE